MGLNQIQGDTQTEFVGPAEAVLSKSIALNRSAAEVFDGLCPVSPDAFSAKIEPSEAVFGFRESLVRGETIPVRCETRIGVSINTKFAFPAKFELSGSFVCLSTFLEERAFVLRSVHLRVRQFLRWRRGNRLEEERRRKGGQKASGYPSLIWVFHKLHLPLYTREEWRSCAV